MSPQARDSQKLPPGRHGISAGEVVENQRLRIFAAVAASVSSAGYGKTTVEDVISRAGVSRKTFYQHFSNKEDAFLAAYDHAAERVLSSVQEAYSAHGDYVSSARDALERCLDELAADPDVATMGLVEIFAAGPKALERRSDILRRLTELITEHTSDLPPTALGSSLTAETIVGGVLEVIYNRVQRGEVRQLPDLLPDLLYCVVAPFLGHERATEERAKAARRLASRG